MRRGSEFLRLAGGSLLWLALLAGWAANLALADEASAEPAPAAEGATEEETPSQSGEWRVLLSKASSMTASQGTSPRSPLLQESPGGEWFLEWRYSINNTDIKGNRERSFLNDGVNNLGEFTFLHKRPVWGIRRLETMGMYRYTDNFRVDPEVNSFQRGYLRLSGPTFETNFGDSLVNYSRFSFNQNIKGVNAWKRLPAGAGLRLVGTAGVFQDRWGSIFKDFEAFADLRRPPDPRFPTKPYTRVVLGGRAEQSLNERSVLAFNFSHGSDALNSLPREALLPPISNQVASLDTRIQVGRELNIVAELAYSFTKFNRRLQESSRSDYAGRVEVSHRWQRLAWRVDYARFQPNFFSLNARQVQDLQDASGRASVTLTDNVSLEGSFRHTNDNLSGRPLVVHDPATGDPVVLTNRGRTRVIGGTLVSFPFVVDANNEKMTTQVQTPEVRLRWRRLLPSRNLDLSAGYRERRLKTSNDDSFRLDPLTGALVIDPITGEPIPLFRDRVTRIPFLDLTWNLQTTIFGLGYEYRQNRDRALGFNSTFTNRFLASYRGTYFLGDWVVSPNFRFETEPEAKRILRSPLDPEIGSPLVDFPGRDQTRSINASVIVDFPRYLSFEALYRELNAELLTPFTAFDPASGDLIRLFANGGYDRPYYRVALTYKIRNSDDHQVVGSFERAINSFLNPDPTAPDTRSFRENVLQLSLIIRFRR